MTGFLARQIRRVAALIVLAALLVGAPWALWRLGAPLLPNHVPSGSAIWAGLTQRDTGQVFLGALVVIGFLAWACFAICLLAEIGARAAHRAPIRLPGLHAPQAAVSALVGLLIAGTLAINTAPAVLAATLPALPHPAPAAITATTQAAQFENATYRTATHTPTPQPARPPAAHAHPGAKTSGPVWTVTKGDTLWSIAEQTLGKGSRWPDIAALNEGRPQPDGRTLVSANWLQIGWKLQLPADAHLPGAGTQSGAETVTVQPGDTLSKIAQQTLGDGNLYPKLATTNHIDNPDLIYPGQAIRIPAPTSHHNPGTAGSAASDKHSDTTNSEGTATGDTDSHAAGRHQLTTGDGNPKHPISSSSPATPDPAAPVDPTPPESSRQEPAHHTADTTAAAAASQAIDGGTNTNGHPGAAASTPAEPHGPGTATNHSAGAAGTNALTNTPDTPTSPATPLQTQTPTASAAASSSDSGVWVLGGLTTLAAAAAWAGLLLVRRRGEQARRPGQRPPTPTPQQAKSERALRERATRADPSAINGAMRTITATVARHAPAGFTVVEIDPDAIRLHPAEPAPPPEPLTGDEHTWSLPLPATPLADPETLAPIPTLITLGTTDNGTTIAIDLEHLGALQITGDPDRCRQLANHMIVELAHTPRCDGIHLHLLGRDSRYRTLGDDRIEPCDNPDSAVGFLSRHLAATRDVLDGKPITVAREGGDDTGVWEPHILVCDGSLLSDAAAVDDLIDQLQTGPPATSALLTFGQDIGIAATATIDPDGTLHMPELLGDTGIHAAAVTDDELDTIIELFTAAEHTTDPPAVDTDAAAPDGGDEPDLDAEESTTSSDGSEVDLLADSCAAASPAAIAKRSNGTRPREPAVDTDQNADAVPSLNGHHHPAAATTSRPAGANPATREAPHDDPALDEDLAEWHANDTSRPRIAILGPTCVTGVNPSEQELPARMKEIAVYLALHPAGVSTDKFATDLWPDDQQPTASGRRAAISHLRTRLGNHPGTNEPFLPSRPGRYILNDRLLDAELFARLVSRADSRARNGDPARALTDLQTALGLARGPVLPEVAGTGYTWLANPDRMDDRVLPMQIIDAAHTTVDLALAAGDAPAADRAAKIARMIDPYSNIPLCDLIRVAQASGDEQTAYIWARLTLQVNDVDLPADLPEPARHLVTHVYSSRRGRRPPVGVKAPP